MNAPAKTIPAIERAFTYADYQSWELAPGERYELIYGQAFAMAAPNAYHQSILAELTTQFQSFLRGKSCKVYPAPYDVRLFYADGGANEQDHTVVQPDLSVVCDPRKRAPEGCRGAPDLVVEILSPGNSAIEMERKFELYRKAGVREYWVIEPEHQILHAYRFEGDRIFTRSFSRYDTAAVDSFPGLSIALEPVFAE